ncbi:Undecaprenyl pyrophosphate synthase [Rhodothermus marinus SG0.5JP17-172]|uniref:isoprenyl transferase n=1 Tax=Rhodothermus marinus TaxID=29549 RepID=UPI000223D7B6|nr:isoprenyl transferase [Rhodothermus marinus]AEN72837.1 Undecaprenyl pyrophosphate synthase [Rhodothermus marinus SG0.5JP17-172]MBO2491691.1 isoprenyl transferase [Rhodothermus marinus]
MGSTTNTADPVTITGKVQTEEDRALQEELRQRGPLPVHIAIIMDGNGRWAQQQGKRRVVGHYEGVESVRDITEACVQLGIPYLTLYTFSTENWQRPASEVNALMQLLVKTIRREKSRLLENGVQLRVVGDVAQLPPVCRAELEQAVQETARNDRLVLTLALSYSGRWEILQAVRTLARRVQEGALRPEDIDEATFAAALPGAGLPDPDLLIRTGGEFRVSNFLLWQIAYTELYITDIYWPAFRRRQLYEAIRSYQNRERRFGRIYTSDTNGIE